MDELWVREPRLMVPKLSPAGSVRVNPELNVFCAYVNAGPITSTPTVSQRTVTVRDGTLCSQFVASTDRISFPYRELSDSLIIVYRANRLGLGGGSYGRLFSAPTIELNGEVGLSTLKVVIGGRTIVPSDISGDHVAAIHFLDGAITMWINGTIKTSIGAGSNSYSKTAGTMMLGNRYTDLARVWDGTVSLFAMLKGNNALAASLSLDPYQFLIPA